MKSRNELPKFFKDQGYKVGVEIGVQVGEFTEELCKEGLTIYGVDPWIGFSGQGRSQKIQEVQDGYYETAKKRLDQYENCIIIRKTSMDALEDFADESLDFVYIDGDHNFRHTAEDIFEWAKKVRVGGVVSGHDYFNTRPDARNIVCQVRAVVDAYVKLFEIKNLQILDGDKHPSWLWKKESYIIPTIG